MWQLQSAPSGQLCLTQHSGQNTRMGRGCPPGRRLSVKWLWLSMGGSQEAIALWHQRQTRGLGRGFLRPCPRAYSSQAQHQSPERALCRHSSLGSLCPVASVSGFCPFRDDSPAVCACLPLPSRRCGLAAGASLGLAPVMAGGVCPWTRED